MARRKKRWIKKALRHHHEGTLHRALHVPKGTKISLKKLQSAVHKSGKLGMRARFALAMRKIQLRRKRRKLSHRRKR